MKTEKQSHTETTSPFHLPQVMFMEDWEIEELMAQLMQILEQRKQCKKGGQNI